MAGHRAGSCLANRQLARDKVSRDRDFASGDSIATAQVSGVVALMLARDPGLTVDLAYRVLRDSAGGPGAAPGSSVDAAAALLAPRQSSLSGLEP